MVEWKRLGALLALASMAPISAFSAGTSGTAAATAYEIDSYDQIVIVDGNWENPDGCTTSQYVILPMSNPSYKEMWLFVIRCG